MDEARRAWHWAEGHQDQLARVLADASGVDVSAEKIAAARGSYAVLYITPDVIRQQQSIADTFSKLGLIPHAVQIADAVWTPGTATSSLTGHRQ